MIYCFKFAVAGYHRANSLYSIPRRPCKGRPHSSLDNVDFYHPALPSRSTVLDRYAHQESFEILLSAFPNHLNRHAVESYLLAVHRDVKSFVARFSRASNDEPEPSIVDCLTSDRFYGAALRTSARKTTRKPTKPGSTYHSSSRRSSSRTSLQAYQPNPGPPRRLFAHLTRSTHTARKR